MCTLSNFPLVIFGVPILIGIVAVLIVLRLFKDATFTNPVQPKKECDHLFSVYSSHPTLQSSCMLCGQEHPDSGKFPGRPSFNEPTSLKE